MCIQREQQGSEVASVMRLYILQPAVLLYLLMICSIIKLNTRLYAPQKEEGIVT